MPHTPAVATRSAKMMAYDAWNAVTKAHTGLTTHYLKNQVSMAVSGLTTESKVSIGVTVGIGAGVAIAALATGGLAIPVLITIGGAGYLLNNLITKLGEDYRRANRNWIKRSHEVGGFGFDSHAQEGTIEASDALRRAVDHFIMMRTIGNEVSSTANINYASCEDAINHVKAVARFIHHGDKVRNYTLPVLDLMIFYMQEYQQLLSLWVPWEARYTAALQAYFEQHGTHSCCPGGGDKDVCYAPFSGMTFSRGGTSAPAKRFKEATEAFPATFPTFTSVANPEAIKVNELLEGMKAARTKIRNGMHVSAAETFNYSAARPTTRGVAAATPEQSQANKRRHDALIDAVWKQVDRPGYFTRGTRRMAHWYSRHTATEMVGQVVSEGLAIGSIFLPMVQGANALTEIGKKAVSQATSAGTLAADKVGVNLLKGAQNEKISCTLLTTELVEQYAKKDILAAGAGIQAQLPKLMLHFGKAAAAVKALGEAGPTINSCNEAMALSVKVCEITAQMAKVGAYAGPCIGIVDVLCKEAYSWTEKEAEMWGNMEERVGNLLADAEVHASCRNDGKKCYGARHARVGTNLLGRGGTWALVTNEPHNAIT